MSIFLSLFQYPCYVVRNIHGFHANGKRRIDVAFERVANHDHLLRLAITHTTQLQVFICGFLVGNDHIVEKTI